MSARCLCRLVWWELGPSPPSVPENFGEGPFTQLCAGSGIVMLGHSGDICKQMTLKAPYSTRAGNKSTVGYKNSASAFVLRPFYKTRRVHTSESWLTRQTLSLQIIV